MSQKTAIIQIDVSALTERDRDKLYYILCESDSDIESEINKKAIKDISRYSAV